MRKNREVMQIGKSAYMRGNTIEQCYTQCTGKQRKAHSYMTWWGWRCWWWHWHGRNGARWCVRKWIEHNRDDIVAMKMVGLEGCCCLVRSKMENEERKRWRAEETKTYTNRLMDKKKRENSEREEMKDSSRSNDNRMMSSTKGARPLIRNACFCFILLKTDIRLLFGVEEQEFLGLWSFR